PGAQGISVGAGLRPTPTGLFAARSSAALGSGVLGGIAAALWYNWVRFDDAFTFGYTEGFGQPLLVGLGAFLFSLDRSVLLYAPPLLALPATLGGVWQRERRVTFLCLGLGLATILIYARWDAFWGGPVWGPRYLLPALPLLLLLLAPGVEAAARGSRRWQVGLGLAGVVGALINAGGVLFDRYAALQEFGQRYPLILRPPRLAESDWAWVRPGSRGLDIAWLPIALAVLLLGLAFVAVHLARTNDTPGSPAGFPRPHGGRYPGTGTWLGLVALAFLVSLFCLREAARIGFGFPSRPGYHEAAHAVASEGQTGDVLVLNLAPFQDWGGALLWFANYYKAPVATAALFRAPPPDEVAIGRLDALARRHERIWLLTQDVAPGDPSSTAEAWLSRHTFPLDDRWLTNLRLSRFVARSAPLRAAGPFVLEGGISLHRALAPTHVSDGEAVAVELEWQPDAPIAEDLHVFVQLLAPDGTRAAGRDSLPQNGYAPTRAWTAGQRVVDRHALLPPAPGIYQLIAGLYDSANGTRLATGAGADFVDLGQVRVGQ
ncbi:MAG TPA: hypothetical protein VER55_13735, partial [Ardenticatenaceae bacterium]|nr:hypothetical protein [Ardenticatenaceae bacterium]